MWSKSTSVRVQKENEDDQEIDKAESKVPLNSGATSTNSSLHSVPSRMRSKPICSMLLVFSRSGSIDILV